MIGNPNPYYHHSIKGKVNPNKDIPIYKFIPIKYLFNYIQNKHLLIGQTQNWEDVYENFLTKSTFYLGKTPISFNQHAPGFYGQSWTTLKESDALWRIYSTNNDSVRIKSSINRLLNAVKNEIDFEQFSTIAATVGAIQYITDNEIVNWINEIKTRINSTILIDSLFIKRDVFKHEKEIRLIIHKSRKHGETQRGEFKSHIKLLIDPNDFIDEITFDPRINNDEFKNYSEILSNMGFINKINKSNLYTLRKLEFLI